MCSTEAGFSNAQRQQLLQLARDSIVQGLDHGCALSVHAQDYPEALRAEGASFVTLLINRTLRGCIGSLQAHRPLVSDIADNAYAAAFCDSRFAPLRKAELAELEIHLSILSVPQALTFRHEADLLAQLRPGIDGLILNAPGHRGTFLPSVWASLPRAEDFLRQLKRKAGLMEDYWSPEIEVERYTTESF